MVEPKNGSTILKPQNVKAVTTKFDIAKPQKRDSDNHINGKALTINFDRHPKNKGPENHKDSSDLFINKATGFVSTLRNTRYKKWLALYRVIV